MLFGSPEPWGGLWLGPLTGFLLSQTFILLCSFRHLEAIGSCPRSPPGPCSPTRGERPLVIRAAVSSQFRQGSGGYPCEGRLGRIVAAESRRLRVPSM